MTYGTLLELRGIGLSARALRALLFIPSHMGVSENLGVP